MTWRAVTRVAWVLLAGLVAWSMVTHWYGWRFGMGIWPVPQGTPWTYQLESGFVPALTVLSLLTAVVGTYHLHNCHSARCWRLGKHKIGGTPWCTLHLDEGRAYHGADVTLQHVTERLDEVIRLLGQLAGSQERM